MNQPDHPLGGQWLTTKEVAKLLGIKEGTVRGWASRGRMPPPDGHVGPSNIWKRETIERWAAQRPRKGKPRS
jgi:predicted DNA-binding transcriptional regulator AlpA